MTHPFEALKPEYSQLLSIMIVRPECRDRVDAIARQILSHRPEFEEVSRINGVPVALMGASFYREADLDFTKNPAQGAPLNEHSKIIPHNGPFPDWKSAALAAYHINGLDRVGAQRWTWELGCFYVESLNGFGYRDVHHMHSPYLWGGTNIQAPGKYVADGVFDPTKMDAQLGVIPLARHVVELAPDLAFVTAIPAPLPSGLATSDDPKHDTAWLQKSLNELGWSIAVDGSYGQETKQAVREFQGAYGLKDDGYAGPDTMAAVDKALAAKEKTS